MKPHPALLAALAVVALAQAPTRPPLTADSETILRLCRRGADVAVMLGTMFPEHGEYYRGQSDALLSAAEWLQDYLPREYPGWALPPPPVVPEPPAPPADPRRPTDPLKP